MLMFDDVVMMLHVQAYVCHFDDDVFIMMLSCELRVWQCHYDWGNIYDYCVVSCMNNNLIEELVEYLSYTELYISMMRC